MTRARWMVGVLAVFLAAIANVGGQPAAPIREICITVDDLPWVSAVPVTIESTERRTRQLLAGFARHRIPAIGFVNEGKLYSGGTLDPGQVGLLRQWIDAGLELGNHTYGHRDLHATPLEIFQHDIVRGEKVTAELLAGAGKRPRFFRHPMLHTGRTLETKRALEAFLAERGYLVAPVTVDNYDYLFARAYDRAAGAERQKIADTYLDYMTAVVAFYEQQSVAIVGREVRQILLLHANALNADTIDRLARMLEGRGYTFVTIDRALDDAAYKSNDTYTGPAGITWLHRWAMTAGKPGSIFSGEPTVPAWIDRAGR